PANTESCRCAPPGTTAVTLRTPCCISSMRARSTSEAPTTTTMRPTSGDNATRRAACRSMGTPATATNALGMVAPRRSPRPAATITAAVVQDDHDLGEAHHQPHVVLDDEDGDVADA